MPMLSVVEAARRLYDLGVNLVVVRYGAKAPPLFPWEAYRTRRASPEELAQWFATYSPCNLAAIAGEVSGGLAILDFESPSVFEQVLGSGFLGSTLAVRTGRGVHAYFRSGSPVPSRATWFGSDGSLAMELRADGHYVLTVGSRHPSGRTYARISRTWSIAKLSDLWSYIKSRASGAGLRASSSTRANSCRSHVPLVQAVSFDRQLTQEARERIIRLLLPLWKLGFRHQLTISLAAFLMKHNVRFDDTYSLVDTLADKAHDEEHASRLRDVVYHYRCRAHMKPALRGLSGIREIARTVRD